MSRIRTAAACGAGLLVAAGFMFLRAQDPATDTPADVVSADPLPVSDPSCTFFGANREKFIGRQRLERATLTANVAAQLAPAADVMAAFVGTGAVTVAAMPSAPGGSRTYTLQQLNSGNNIDKYLFQAMTDAGVAPAPPTTDFEFVRRVTLDLTGRIPTAAAVTTFVNDSASDKRAKLVESLLAAPEWVDKWTIWF